MNIANLGKGITACTFQLLEPFQAAPEPRQGC